jgi:hypothetical protein
LLYVYEYLIDFVKIIKITTSFLKRPFNNF